VTSAPSPAPRWAERFAATLAFSAPVLLALGHLSLEPRWDEDVAVVRALGGQIGAEGIVSGALSTRFALLPLGSRLMRAALPSALAVGLVSLLLFQLAVALLERRRGPSFGELGLAGFAALGATLLPSFQIEASRVGGATVAALLILGLLRVSLLDPGRVVARGLLLGLLLAESHWGALAGLVIVIASLVRRDVVPRARDFFGLFVTAALTLGVLLLPSLLHPRTPGSGIDFSFSLGLPLGTTNPSGLSMFAELGLVCCPLAALGVLWVLPRARLRPLLLTSLAAVGVELVEAAPAVRLAAIACCMLFATFGLRFCLAWLERARLPLTPLLGRLVFLLGVGLLLLSMEDSRRALDRRSVSAARAWTAEAFGDLPPGALVISDAPEIAWRLWASRVTEGTRPDVMLVPNRLLGRGNVARELLRAEPRIAGLIRDHATYGTVSELSLSELADARPLKVELDYDWDKRLLAYLTPDGVWSDVAPHALGHSDRKTSYKAMRRVFNRILRQASTERGTDRQTVDRVTRDLYHQALVSATLGDNDLAEHILHRLSKIRPDDPAWEHLRRKLEHSSRGAPSVRAMLE
jgi:hypothetical protein